MLIAVTANNALGYILAFVAAAFAAMNVVGGYVVTGRMLKMFRRSPHARSAAGGQRPAGGPDGRRAAGERRPAHERLRLDLPAALCRRRDLLRARPAPDELPRHGAPRQPGVHRRHGRWRSPTTLALVIHAGTVSATGWIVMIAGALLGGGAGLYAARTVEMTAMPQLVSIFNAVGGGAAALVAINDYVKLAGASAGVAESTTVATVLDVLIGAVTFSGSIIAAGKLQGLINGAPVTFPGSRAANIAAAVIGIGGGIYMIATPSVPALVIIILAALAFGVTMVLPIGGADMPVVISLLNAFTGTAVAMAGFVIGNWALIIAGALVGASGSILTKLMADAMNRSLRNIMIGGFGTGDSRPRRWRARAATCGRSPPTTRPSSSPTRRRSSSCPATAWPPPRRSTRWPSWPRCWRSAASRSATPSTRSRAACPAT